MSRTVTVRIAVAVSPAGSWSAHGGIDITDRQAMDDACECLDQGEARFWLTAELPVPESAEVAATVEAAT